LNKEKLHEYTISRPLYQYFANKPAKDSAIYNFLMFELSAQGKDIVRKSGFDDITTLDNSNNEELLRKI